MRTISTWGDRLMRARNVVTLVLLAVAFAFRSEVAWRQWERRHPTR